MMTGPMKRQRTQKHGLMDAPCPSDSMNLVEIRSRQQRLESKYNVAYTRILLIAKVEGRGETCQNIENNGEVHPDISHIFGLNKLINMSHWWWAKNIRNILISLKNRCPLAP
jgi:hypothetical protein